MTEVMTLIQPKRRLDGNERGAIYQGVRICDKKKVIIKAITKKYY